MGTRNWVFLWFKCSLNEPISLFGLCTISRMQWPKGASLSCVCKPLLSFFLILFLFRKYVPLLKLGNPYDPFVLLHEKTEDVKIIVILLIIFF